MKYWLMKSEPDVYSIKDLQRDKTTWWEGVRNYQARNFMRDEMQMGDLAFFYHSNAEPSGIVGLMRVVSEKAQPDLSALDKKSPYYDSKANLEKPIWCCVQLEFVEEFKRPLSLAELKTQKALKNMLVVQKGQRLSVQPVSAEEFNCIKKLFFLDLCEISP